MRIKSNQIYKYSKAKKGTAIPHSKWVIVNKYINTDFPYYHIVLTKLNNNEVAKNIATSGKLENLRKKKSE